ncbi:ABC transporter substrate-binding protein [Streptomyces virginiae]|uniref:ABC transporter substrate-binding protein n=1 Tax=Streptomyces virginiae TaxID=1961 RepID=A0ABQ3NQH3_STRVG|nr:MULTISPECIES: extracellular solute-binding protein [Streptomyces]MBP2347808.1 putative spermidine/putrescine transport system substrate-binding protein [Streptomyces virginiae]MCI4086081.1 extracellular solute-binding protein [Streptomyces sp. MMS21 TC-5]GGP95024.1 ABC transporter substrate-binding protein [Streptomyces virginiae]GHI15011.1 ABC transporter substrate-binding protein [Streptomyces virginiae]GLV88790.1 ABC transporter substrate-binding protein [Streptomyces lavendulae subsp. l
MPAPRLRTAAVAACLALAAGPLGACGDRPPATPRAPAVATSAADAGGMAALTAAARKEGALNTIALPRDWAGYGALIDGFEKKYGIEVAVENPEGSSQDEVNALKEHRRDGTAPDVIDVGGTFGPAAARQGLLAPYEVVPYDDIPDEQKDPRARWYDNYGGYVSIGCDAKRVKTCPSTFADLRRPEYKGQVSLNGDPTKSGSAFAGVYAAALANGGSFDNIQPGIDFFAELSKNGNFIPVESTPATIETGRTPISIDWDFLNLGYADDFRRKGADVDWRTAIPFDGSFAQYYAQGVNKDAPHPAAARLWQEYLFSPEGQNIRLRAYARPVLMETMEENGTLDRAAAEKLPTVEGTPTFPTEAQQEKAARTVDREWAEAVSG